LLRYLGNQQVFMDEFQNIYVSKSARDAIDCTTFPEIRFARIPVVEKPLDVNNRPMAEYEFVPQR